MNKIIEYLRVTTRLLGNAARFRLAARRSVPLPLEALSLAVTGRCNSRCIMCNIWRGGGGRELSGDEIIRLLSRPLFSRLVELDLTGGEPHLRDDLAELVLNIAALKKRCLPHLKSIVITSNGLLPERVVANYPEILEGIRGSGIDLVSVASIDGIGETHDRVRGTPGAFALAARTIDGLLGLRREFANYYVGLKTTVLPLNVGSLDAILDWARERGLFHIISPVFFTGGRFRNIDKQESLKPSAADAKKLLEFYSRRELENGYFYSRMKNFLETGHKGWRCTAGYNYLFIDADGTVHPCELSAAAIGNVREQAIEDIWRGERARQWRRDGGTERCQTCLEPGAIRYSAAAEGLAYLGFLRAPGRRRFRESLHGEGLIKYLTGR
jgi:MoaA/NifB/PqqE/SkfB family radical SAM enzyme